MNGLRVAVVLSMIVGVLVIGTSDACAPAQTKVQTAIATTAAECAAAERLALGEAGATSNVDRLCERRLKAIDVDAGAR